MLQYDKYRIINAAADPEILYEPCYAYPLYLDSEAVQVASTRD